MLACAVGRAFIKRYYGRESLQAKLGKRSPMAQDWLRNDHTRGSGKPTSWLPTQAVEQS